MFCKVLGWLSVAGGCVSFLGDLLIRIALSLLISSRSTDFSQAFAVDPRWTALAFLSGFLTVAFLAPSFIRKVQSTATPAVNRLRYGAYFGAVAGVSNIVILASIHLSLLFGSAISEGLKGTVGVIYLFLVYVPISVLILGLPAVGIGMLAGIIAEIILRKFVFSRETSSLT